MGAFDGLPRTIKVGHRDFRVEMIEHWDSVDLGVFGNCDSNQGLIRLDAHMDRYKAVDTVIHELTHAAWFTFGHKSEKLSEEDVCKAVGRVFATIFRDNPDLLAWVSESLA